MSVVIAAAMVEAQQTSNPVNLALDRESCHIKVEPILERFDSLVIYRVQVSMPKKHKVWLHYDGGKQTLGKCALAGHLKFENRTQLYRADFILIASLRNARSPQNITGKVLLEVDLVSGTSGGLTRITDTVDADVQLDKVLSANAVNETVKLGQFRAIGQFRGNRLEVETE